MSACTRKVGVWRDDDEVVMASCWERDGHFTECFDARLGLRWTPGKGVDSSGRVPLIDPADLPFDGAAAEAFMAVPLPGRDARRRRPARSRP